MQAGIISQAASCLKDKQNHSIIGAIICSMQGYAATLTPAKTWPRNQATSSEIDEVKYYLDYSGATYCDPNNIQTWSFDGGKPTTYQKQLKQITVTSSEKDQTVGYTGYNPERNEIIIAFRGTSTTANWIGDFDDIQTEFTLNHEIIASFGGDSVPSAKSVPGDALVHDGFQKLGDSLMPGLARSYSQLLQSYPNAVRTVVTGHSLGAGMATICSAKFALLHPHGKFHVALYGSPRSGTGAWVKWYHSHLIPQNSVYRLDNMYDAVPWTPLPKSGYLAVGQEYFNAPMNPNDSPDIFYNTTTQVTFKCGSLDFAEDPTCNARSRSFSRQIHSWYFGHKISGFCTEVKVTHSLLKAVTSRIKKLF